MSEMAARIAAQLADKKTAADVGKARIDYQLKNEERRAAAANARASIVEARQQDREKQQATQQKQQAGGAAESRNTQQTQSEFEKAATLPMVANPGSQGNVGANQVASSGGAGDIVNLLNLAGSGASPNMISQGAAPQPSSPSGASPGAAPPTPGTQIQQAPGSQLPAPVPGGRWQRQAQTIPGRDLRTGHPVGNLMVWGLNKAIGAMGGPEHFIGTETETYVTDTLVKSQVQVDEAKRQLGSLNINNSRENLRRASGKEITSAEEFDRTRDRRGGFAKLVRERDQILKSAGPYAPEVIQGAREFEQEYRKQRSGRAQEAARSLSESMGDSPEALAAIAKITEGIYRDDHEMVLEGTKLAIPLSTESAKLTILQQEATRENTYARTAAARASTDKTRQNIRHDEAKFEAGAEGRRLQPFGAMLEGAAAVQRVADQQDVAQYRTNAEKRAAEAHELDQLRKTIAAEHETLRLNVDTMTLEDKEKARVRILNANARIQEITASHEHRKQHQESDQRDATLERTEAGTENIEERTKALEIENEYRPQRLEDEETIRGVQAEHAKVDAVINTQARQVALEQRADEVNRGRQEDGYRVQRLQDMEELRKIEIKEGNERIRGRRIAARQRAIQTTRDMVIGNLKAQQIVQGIKATGEKMARDRDKSAADIARINASTQLSRAQKEAKMLEIEMQQRVNSQVESRRPWSQRLGIGGVRTEVDPRTGKPLGRMTQNALMKMSKDIAEDPGKLGGLAWPVVGEFLNQGLLMQPGKAKDFWPDKPAKLHNISPQAATEAIFVLNYKPGAATDAHHRTGEALEEAGYAHKVYITDDNGEPFRRDDGSLVVGKDGKAPWVLAPTETEDPYQGGVAQALFQYANEVSPGL